MASPPPVSPPKNPAVVHDYYSGLEVVPPGEGLESTTSPNHTSYKGYNPVPPHLQHSYPEVVPAGIPADGYGKERVTDENRPRWPQPGSGPKWGEKWTKKQIWFVAVMFVVLIVLGIVLGVAVGMTRSKSNSNSSSRTPDTASTTQSTISSSTSSRTSSITSKTSSSSSTTTAQTAFPTTALSINCPALNGTTTKLNTSSTVSPAETFTFNLFCNVNFGAGLDSAVKNTSSLQECLQSCADIVAEGATCVGVVWDSVMNLALTPPKNCFMKGSSTGFVYTGTSNISAAGLVVGSGEFVDASDVDDDPPS